MKTEVIAGVTTFLTMAYILIVQPLTLQNAGMDFGGSFTATAIASIVGTLVMAFAARLPFALAPGMGLNAFFAFSVVIGMGKTWQFALTAVFLEGLIFLALTGFNVREAIVNNDATLVSLGNFGTPAVLVAIIGLALTGVLVALRVKGALLLGILGATVIGIPFGVTSVSEGFRLVSMPPSLAPVAFQFEWTQILTLDMLIVVFTFLFVDMFDTVGTLVGVAQSRPARQGRKNSPRKAGTSR